MVLRWSYHPPSPSHLTGVLKAKSLRSSPSLVVICLRHRKKLAESTWVRSVLSCEFQQSRLDGRGRREGRGKEQDLEVWNILGKGPGVGPGLDEEQ